MAPNPELDPEFIPAVIWNKTFLAAAKASGKARPFALALEQPNGSRTVFRTQVLAPDHERAADNLFYVERLLKFLLWANGGWRVQVCGAPELVAPLQKLYGPGGGRVFDYEMIGQKMYGRDLVIEALDYENTPDPVEPKVALGRHLDGCRIGFDLGGSDRKCAAVIDGKVVFSDEVPWDPYFQANPQYHLDGIRHSLAEAAKHLPRVDAIGGSAAGIYMDNQVRVASLFRGIPEEQFEEHVRPIFLKLKEEWNGIPFEVINDGEVTALAGSISLDEQSVLGISMGTSLAAGYVDPNGHITTRLNELAFTPIDYRKDAPVDEWSGDHGCGVQYFSQQAIARLIAATTIEVPENLPLPERLIAVQDLMEAGDERAAAIYRTIGTCFGYAIAHYTDFYTIRNLLVLGRVTSGEGGEIIIREARALLKNVFPELGESIRLSTPDEKMKRHGQAIAAASLPDIRTKGTTP